MRLLDDLRDRFSARTTEPDAPRPPDAGDQAAPADDMAPPIEGYDRLDTKQLSAQMHRQTQAGLASMETYERAHRNRVTVLDKLRYMRGSEPFQGYDAMSTGELLDAVGKADIATLKRVRDYERKFSNRGHVVDATTARLRESRAQQPAEAPPAYQPTSARS